MKHFSRTSSGTVIKDWIDRNGHMNVTAYMRLFDEGTDVLLKKCGFEENSDITVVASRMQIDYRRELMEGEAWELWSGVVFADFKSIIITHRLRAEKSIRAVCDIQGYAFSKASRASTILNAAMLGNIHAFIIPGLINRFDLERCS